MKRTCTSVSKWLKITFFALPLFALTRSYDIKNGHDAMMFLNRFGYIDKEDMMMKPEMDTHTKEMMPMVKNYQKMCGLNMTGKLDTQTVKMMNTPRCGNRDMKSEPHFHVSERKKRYVLYSASTKWMKPEVSFKISMFSERMGIQVTEQQVLAQVILAFQMFQEYIPLDFVHRPSMNKVDIDLAFTSQYHMQDQFPFDGPGSTLAHAFPPGNHKTSGMVHFDDVEDWTVNSPKGTNVLYVAVHEIGHALGLSHSSTKGAIMFPSYGGYRPVLQLHQDDIQGLQALYGKREGMKLPAVPLPFQPKLATRPPVPTPTTAITTTTVRYEAPVSHRYVPPTQERRPQYTPSGDQDRRFPKVGKDPRNLCQDPKIDAITTMDDGHIYIFKGDYVFQLSTNGQGVNGGWPKNINSLIKGLPGNLDAAVTLSTKKSYFFKGDKYWRTTGKKIDSGYPKSISSNFIGIPNSVDAAFTNLGKVYFIKGDKYWGFDPKVKPFVSRVYPLPIEKWGLKVRNIDAAFVAPHDVIYFFREDEYWKFDDRTFQIAQTQPPYPRSSKLLWFACTAYRPDLRNIRDSSSSYANEFESGDESAVRRHKASSPHHRDHSHKSLHSHGFHWRNSRENGLPFYYD